MKQKWLWSAGTVLLASGGILIGGSANAQDTRGDGEVRCSVATLRGMYLFAIEGMAVDGSEHLPFAGAGYEVYDGRGNLSVHISFSENGAITRNAQFPGTYTVNRDCTGTSTLPSRNETFDMFVAPDGSMFTFVSTVPGVVFSGSAQRMARRVGG
jgi:hypothetical protein